MTEEKTSNTAKAEKEALTGTTECRWCKEEEEYEAIVEIGAEVTTRCSNCSLKIWIRGDGWKKYKELHDLEEGCEKEEKSKGSYGISDWADTNISTDDTTVATYNSATTDFGVPEEALEEARDNIIREARYRLGSSNSDE